MAVTRTDLELLVVDVRAMARLDLQGLPLGASLFILRAKLEALVEQVEMPDIELGRLREWSKSARAVLAGGYGVQTATWKHADGSPVLMRMLDEEAVLKVLRG